MIPPAASEAPTSARSNPVSAPSASSADAQSHPRSRAASSPSCPQELLRGQVQRTIALRCSRFNASCKTLLGNSCRRKICHGKGLRRSEISGACRVFFPGFLFCRIRVAASRKFAASFRAQPFLLIWWLRATPSDSAGTFFADCRSLPRYTHHRRFSPER